MRSLPYPTHTNERAARLLAGVVGATVLLAWRSDNAWLLPLLAVGFVLRAAAGPRLSPLARLAGLAATRLWPPRPVPAAPKRFAQGIGAVCLTTATVLAYGGQPGAAWLVALVVVVFAALEAALGFCMGCWLYGRLQRSGLLGPAVCVDCAPAATRAAMERAASRGC